MEIIPNELLYEVLSYLTIEERESSRVVSKKWRDLVPYLPIKISKQTKEEVLGNMKKLAIQLFFLFDILDLNYEEKSKHYTFLDENQKQLFKLHLDPYNEIKSVYNISLSREIYDDIDRFVSMDEDDNHSMEMFLNDMEYILFRIPEIRYILTNDELKDIDDISKTLEVIFYLLQENTEQMFTKIPMLKEIYTNSLYENYLNVMEDIKRKILSYIPNYIKNDKDLLQKYILNVIS
jgi:hypothetical protein